MKDYCLPLALLLLLGSCTKKDIDIDFEKDFCSNRIELVADDDIVDDFAIDTTKGWYFVPNCFTPNGDGVNDLLEITISYNEGASSSSFESFKVFNARGKLVAEPDFFGWDGKKDGDAAKDGEYAFEAVLKLPDNRLVTLSGIFLLVSGNCVDKEYDMSCLTFPDQVGHPRLGLVSSTAETLSSCN